MESERREECERISISIGFKTSVADRDGNRQMEGDGPRETVSILIVLDLSLLLEPDRQRDKRK